ncbi:GNAT family N-acetyltransferase [Clostridium hydrogeniformans]|uniref:GNAT family N-acetyltransferase n=1 Tax=Clostridium hydrogeniformans TaxID=349933 RepID=UPI000487C43B|nr:GNAT family N-acetyltransferase [Clostridium hydrogeniformans]
MDKKTNIHMKNFKIRFAKEEDIPTILKFIKELASYENLLDQVIATEETLKESLFEKKSAQVIIGEYENTPISFALFFHNFSTFIGKSGLYLEDLYVSPSFRGYGIGKKMLSHLANIAMERGCKRFEWWCLDWNTPSIDFYKSLGAEPMDQWTVYRLGEEDIERLSKA